MTRPYAEVIGDPITHSKSPLIHNFWLAKLGIDAEYRKTHVRAEDLAEYFTRRRSDPAWRGCNVTIPHKQTSSTLVDSLSPDATKIGAVNTIIPSEGGLGGHNTDAEGIRTAIASVTLRGASVGMIGAGGAARAAMQVFKEADVLEVLIAARSAEKALALNDEFRMSGGGYDLNDCGTVFAGVDLIVNASPLGMVGGESFSPEILTHLDLSEGLGSSIFDMVYAPLDTELLRAADARGFQTIDGLQMLVGQAAAAFELFFGQPAPRGHDAELRALLTA